jgi:hypothetical protein
VSVLNIVLGQLGLIKPPPVPGLHDFPLWVPLPFSKENSPFFQEHAISLVRGCR